MMTLTRNDLVMMLDKMDKNNADNIELDMRIKDGYVEYIDFDMYHDIEYIGTVLTLD